MRDELQFFVEVQIRGASHLETDLAKQVGVVIGKSQDEETNEWFYTVMVYGVD